MTATPAEAPAAPAEQLVVAAPAQVFTPQEPAQAAQPAAVEAAPEETFPWDDPEEAKAEIKRLRRENATQRVDPKAAADAARNELTQSLAKALGLVKDDEPADPKVLTEQLTAAQKTAADTARDFAIFKAATAAKADPQALLDSLAFRQKVEGIDPSDTAALEAAIKDAVSTNPRFKTVQAAGASGADFAGGTGEGAITQARFDAMTPSERNELHSTNPTLYRTLAGR